MNKIDFFIISNPSSLRQVSARLIWPEKSCGPGTDQTRWKGLSRLARTIAAIPIEATYFLNILTI
jgi:hypothetical protein